MKKKIRPYKRTLPLLLGCLLAFVLFGCGGEDSGGTEEDSLLQDVMEGEESGAGGSQAGESGAAGGEDGSAGAAADEQADSETADGIRVQVSRVSEQQTKNTDNMLLLRNRSQSVSVVIPDNQEAEEAVNGFFTDRRLSYGDTVAQYREAALATMAAGRPEQEAEGGNGEWTGFELGLTYRVARADEQMICIVEDSYEYTGGAHGNFVRVAYNFDSRTGERLTLADAASDLDEIRSESVRYMGEQIQKPEWEISVNDDYANHLEDVLTDATWYTDADGFHIICNASVIAGRAAGTFEFLLPYDEVDVIAEQYIPAPPAKDDRSE